MRLTCNLAFYAVCLFAVSTSLPLPSHAEVAASGTIQPVNTIPAPDDSKRKWAEKLLDEVQKSEAGMAQFTAINDLAKKAKEGDAADRNAILSVVIKTLNDKSLKPEVRWPCCYIIGGSGDERAVPYLVQALLHDESDVVRSTAAESLGSQVKNSVSHDAMMESARQETSGMVRDVLARYLGTEMPAAKPGTTAPDPKSNGGVKELAPSGAPKPPVGPKRPVSKPLSWPFPGDQKAQSIFNNYQTFPDDYIHCGLDFIHPAGTPVTAVGPGYVAAISSNPPHTHDLFIVTPQKDGNRGWCYTHMDPSTFTFKEGDSIKQGQLLGKLAEFAVNGVPGQDHLHLNYVAFTKDSTGRVDTHTLLDPLYFFDWKDTESPAFLPLKFVKEGTTDPFEADAAGVTAVKGKVDILAAITDTSCADEKSLFGVPVVMISISDGTHTVQKLVLDHRGEIVDGKQAKPLYLLREETRKVFNTGYFPYFQGLCVTKTDGDGKITPDDAKECWDTTALDGSGKPLWPDGKYSVNVYAWDFSGNRGVMGAVVQIKNKSSAD